CGVPLDLLVLAVGLDKCAQRRVGNAALPDHVSHRQQGWGARLLAGVDAVDVPFEVIEEPKAKGVDVRALVFRLVADVIGETGKAVEREQVLPVPGGQHAQRDGEVLVWRVDEDFVGMGHRRADTLASIHPCQTATTPSHVAYFLWVPLIIATMTRASYDGGVG